MPCQVNEEESVPWQNLGDNAKVKVVNDYLIKLKIHEAFPLLDSLIAESNETAFPTNCVKWLQLCCQICERKEENIGISLKMFDKLVKTSSKFPELSRPIANCISSRFCDVLFKNSSRSEAWEAMETFMIHYSASLASNKESLDNLLRCSETSIEPTPLFKARCWALNPTVGGSGQKNANYSTNWRSQIDKLVNHSHVVLNCLFKDLTEFQMYHCTPDPMISMPPDPSSSDLGTYFSNTCMVIENMLLGRYPVEKSVPVSSLIRLITRVLSVSPNLGKVNVGRINMLRSVVPHVHSTVIKLLNGLCLCAGRSLVPYATQIADMFVQAIHASRANVHVRTCTYSALSNWMVVAGAGSCFDLHIRDIMNMILQDIEDKKKEVQLKGSTKKRAIEMESKLHMGGGKCEVLSFAALQTLSLVINTVGYKLPPDVHKDIQCSVVRQLSDRVAAASSPTSARCRKALYDLLLNLCLEPSPKWPPPTQFAIAFFLRASNDADPSVARAATAAISVVNRIIHPEFSIASFPADYQKVLKDMKKSNAEALPVHAEIALPATPPPVKPITKSSSPWQTIPTSESNYVIDNGGVDTHINEPADKEGVDTIGDKNEGVVSELIVNNAQAFANGISSKVANESEIVKISRNVEDESVSYAIGLEPEDVEIKCIASPKNANPASVLERENPKRRRINDVTLSSLSETKRLRSCSPDVVSLEPVVVLNKLKSPSASSETVENSVCSEDKTPPSSPVLQLSQRVRKPKLDALALDDATLNSPMALRSGTIVSSSSSESSRRRHRDDNSSVSSRSSLLTDADPDSVMQLFDETLNSD